MPTFEEHVRRGCVPQPTQRTFSRQAWEATFGGCPEPTIRDRQLFESGSWFADRLAEVRDAVETVQTDFLRQRGSRRLFVGLVNRDFVVMNRAVLPAEQDRPLHLPALVDRELPMGPRGFPVVPLAAIEAAVSALRFPLSRTDRPAQGGERQLLESPATLASLFSIMNLAGAYHSLEALWQGCLWEGLYVDANTQPPQLRFADPGLARASAVGQYRRDELLSQLATFAFELWRDPANAPLRAAALAAHRTAEVTDRGNVIIRRPRQLPAVPPPDQLMQVAAEQLYWDELLQEPLDHLGGVTLRGLLRAWDVLLWVAEACEQHMPTNTTIQTARDYLPYALPVRRSALLRALVREAHLTPAQAAAALELFAVREHDHRTDLWFTPLVPLPDSRLVVIVPAAATTNRIRLLEYWMRQGQVDLERRGPAFEQHLRLNLRRSIAEGPLSQLARVAPDQVMLRLGGSEEEIDLLIALGTIVLVGEIKCSVFPVSALELFNHRETLKDAQAQVARKAAVLAENLREARESIPELADSEPATCMVVPVVVSNLPIDVGRLRRPVVVDHLILERFFGDGYLPTQVVVSPDGRREEGERIYFYTSAAEAPERLTEYLELPPQVRVLDEHLTLQLRRLPLLAAGALDLEHWSRTEP